MDTTSYEVFLKGKRPGVILKKTTTRVAYSHEIRNGKHYFHFDEDLDDWEEKWAIPVSAVAKIVPRPPPEEIVSYLLP